MLEGHVIDGKYQLVRLVGAGGMSEVWEALHVGLGRPVALKRLSPYLAARPEFVARFLREARFLERLRHPNVVGVYDVGASADSAYLVMELLEGAHLGQVLDARPRLSFPEARTIFLQVFGALRAAHDAGIVHRDIKPTNVFLARAKSSDVVVKVLDFGIAKTTEAHPADREDTRTGLMLGTLLFMSPEQAMGGKVDHRSDLWSLGVVLYLALVGAHPFSPKDRSSPSDFLLALAHDVPPGPSAAGLPPAADAFFARALARDPANRFEDADEMRIAFSALVGFDVASLDGLLAEAEAGAATPNGAKGERSFEGGEKPGSARGVTESFAGPETRPLPADAPDGQRASPGLVAPPAVPPVSNTAETPLVNLATRPWPLAERLPAYVSGGVARAELLLVAPAAVTPRPADALAPGASGSPWGALADRLPRGLAEHGGHLSRFLSALFQDFVPESARLLRLLGPRFDAAGHLRFYAVLLSGGDRGGLLATRTFIAQADALTECLRDLDRRSRKIVIALSDSNELGAGVRQHIFELQRDFNACVVPMHVARVRAAVDEGDALEALRRELVDFHAPPNVFDAGARPADPTNIFGHLRSLIGELVRALARPSVVSVWGPPGCGKTSLVEMARAELSRTRFVCLRCVDLPAPSLVGGASAIAKALEGAGAEPPDEPDPAEGAALPEDPFARLERAARAARERARGEQILLVLEDADLLLKPLVGADEAEQRRARALWAALGRLCDAKLLSVVVTSMTGFVLDEAKIAGWVNPLAGKVCLVQIPPLGPSDVDRMLGELGRQINVRFDPDATDYAYEVSAGNVYALRRLCSYVVDRRRRASRQDPLGEVRIRRRELVAGARDLAAMGDVFNAKILPWLDDVEQLVVEAVAVRRPKGVRGVQSALGEQSPAAVAAALDRLRRAGFVERREGRERVAVPLLEAWARHNLRPGPGEVERRRARQAGTLAAGIAVTTLLVGTYAFWSRPRTAAWQVGSCSYQLQYPRRIAREVESELYAYRTCGGAAAGDVLFRQREGTFVLFGPKEAALALDGPQAPPWRQQRFVFSVRGLSHGPFEFEVAAADRPVELRVDGKPVSYLAIEYDWLAALPDAIKKIIAVASAIPTALGALLAYGKDMAAFARRLLGRE